MIPRFIGPNGIVWFIGRVEDINDPLQLGRVRVRCFGYHTSDTEQLLTEQLPWAEVSQPTISAGRAGRGFSPTGMLVGTVCWGIFLDGPAAQYPMVVGVLGAINARPGTPMSMTPQDILARGSGRSREQFAGEAVVGDRNLVNRLIGESSPNIPTVIGELGSLSEQQYQQLKAAIGQRESSNNYQAVNQYGFVGKYQFGNAALNVIGYTVARSLTNSLMRNPQNWTGKNGASSLELFLRNTNNVQEIAMDELVRHNYRSMLRSGTVNGITPPRELAGYITVAHLLGTGGAANFRRGRDGRDGNGTTGASYFRLGANAITASEPTVR